MKFPDVTRKGHMEFGEVVTDIPPQDTVSIFRIPVLLIAPKLVRISRSRESQDKGGGMWTAWSGQSLV